MLIVPEEHDHYQALIKLYISNAGENPIRIGIELQGVRKNGDIFYTSLSISQMEFAGKLQIIALVADISQQKILEAQAAESERMERELEQERQLCQHKDHFLSMISHEFRTPLSVIRSSNDILKKHYDRLSEEKRQQNFQRIQAKVQELDEMISDILLLSRSEMKLLEFQPQETDLREFVSYIVENVHKSCNTERIDILFNISQKHYPIDQYLLEHALGNLLNNALKYSQDDTSVIVSITNGANRLTFEISDAGIGIPQEDLDFP